MRIESLVTVTRPPRRESGWTFKGPRPTKKNSRRKPDRLKVQIGAFYAPISVTGIQLNL
jgi:hypothetical protein